jgi:SAM-dependent methyltransferase
MSYTPAFFEGQMQGSRKSADRIASLCFDLLRPASVIDIGCGVGTWLAAFRALGVDHIHGVDGDYVDRELLQIPATDFEGRDLAQWLRSSPSGEDEPQSAAGDPPQWDYDLAVCLEVAEHLDSYHNPALVTLLTGLAPVVLFSAAIPHQGGTGHVNEQWQDYWASLFEARGHRAKDCVRPAVWNDMDVEPWYAQNALLYAHASVDLDCAGNWPLRIVHPGIHERRATPGNLPLREVGRHVLPSARVAVRERLDQLK